MCWYEKSLSQIVLEELHVCMHVSLCMSACRRMKSPSYPEEKLIQNGPDTLGLDLKP